MLPANEPILKPEFCYSIGNKSTETQIVPDDKFCVFNKPTKTNKVDMTCYKITQDKKLEVYTIKPSILDPEKKYNDDIIDI
jgi:hypothetical protein